MDTRRYFTHGFAVALLLLGGYLGPARAVTIPLPDIAMESVAIPVTGGANSEYQWWSRYDIGFSQATSTFNINLNIMLNGDDPGDALRATWEQGIEDIWSGQYRISQDNQYSYNVNFNTSFIDTWTNLHQIVTVHSGTGAQNMTNWYTESPSGWPQHKQDEAVAHEAGHMFGNFDEYSGGAVNPDGSFWNVSDSIMGSGLTQTISPRHYGFITDWISGKAPGQTFTVASASSAPPLPGAVPVPPALLLFLSGLGWLMGFGRYRR